MGIPKGIEEVFGREAEPMTVQRAIEVLKAEIKCIKNPHCPRQECYNCYLVMPEQDVLQAFDMAIQALENDMVCKEMMKQV